jgi:hypothetical protein
VTARDLFGSVRLLCECGRAATGPAVVRAELHDYATDLDGNAGVAGRFIDKTRAGLRERDLQKYQTWRTGALASPLAISGDVTLTIGAKMKSVGKDIRLRAFLSDCTTTEDSSCTPFATGDMQSVVDASAASFEELSVTFPAVDGVVTEGHRLQLRVVMLDIRDTDPAYLGYDTVELSSRLTVP